MYFVSKKGKWRTILINSNPYKRYTITFTSFIFLILGWQFGLCPYLDMRIMQDTIELHAMHGQLHTMAQAQRSSAALKQEIPRLQQRYALNGACPIDCEDRIEAIMMDAQRSNVQVVSFGQGNEQESHGCKCMNMQWQLKGTLDHLITFFSQLNKKNSINCSDFNCERNEQNSYLATCAMRVVSAS